MPFDGTKPATEAQEAVDKMIAFLGPNGENWRRVYHCDAGRGGVGCVIDAYDAVYNQTAYGPMPLVGTAARDVLDALQAESRLRGYEYVGDWNDAQTSFSPVRELLLAVRRRLGS
jgi:hypothetical protein